MAGFVVGRYVLVIYQAIPSGIIVDLVAVQLLLLASSLFLFPSSARGYCLTLLGKLVGIVCKVLALLLVLLSCRDAVMGGITLTDDMRRRCLWKTRELWFLEIGRHDGDDATGKTTTRRGFMNTACVYDDEDAAVAIRVDVLCTLNGLL
jgi:hypothetical protein